jgi:CheY-like chemotaxis protein
MILKPFTSVIAGVNSVNNQPVVLVAEDRDDDLFMLRRSFQQLGFETPVQYVRDGDETIAYLAGEGKFANRIEYPLPDLLLLDLKMPRKNGFDVLEWIQGQPELDALRVVVLTTSDDIFEVNRAYKLGASSFLTKPFNFTEFRDIVQAVHNYWLNLNRAPAVERPTGPGIRHPEENYRIVPES